DPVLPCDWRRWSRRRRTWTKYSKIRLSLGSTYGFDYVSQCRRTWNFWYDFCYWYVYSNHAKGTIHCYKVSRSFWITYGNWYIIHDSVPSYYKFGGNQRTFSNYWGDFTFYYLWRFITIFVIDFYVHIK